MSNSNDVKYLMNEWGKASRPFVFLVDFECKQPRIWDASQAKEEIELDIPGWSNGRSYSLHKPLSFQKEPITLEVYQKGFDFVKANLEAGYSFLTNYTAITQLKMEGTLEEIYRSVKSKYKIWYKGHFICFSPETFVRIRDGNIQSFPMKGTINADLPGARELILGNNKEMAEHATIVDLIRNDLSMVATAVEVTQYRNYEEIDTGGKRLGQVSSEITGKLGADYKSKLGDILFSLLPAGSISGAPKKKTVEIIRHAEGEERGYYTGVCGYFDGESLDSCVLIRYLDEQGRYRSGGGITFLSQLEEEYQEMIDKVYVPIY